jgi:hypothetical protein
MMQKYFLTVIVFIFLGLGMSLGEETSMPAAPWRYSVGMGLGYESGNGLNLGLSQGKYTGQLGLGLIYSAQNAELQYSTGLRLLRELYTGRINNTYAWVGLGMHGRDRKNEYGFMSSGGMGVGATLHLGLPFHLSLDSGWHAFYDSEAQNLELQWGPTLNGSLVYEW